MLEDRSAPAPTSQAAINLSGPLKIDLSVYRGDTGRFRITVTEVDGTPIDISLATWDADIRVKADDVDAVGSFDVTPVVGDPSSIDVSLDSALSESLPDHCVYDIEMRQAPDVKTLIYGSITVTHDVSRP